MSAITIDKREYIFSTYVIDQQNKENDLLAVKEHLHMSDGSIRPNMRYIENYQRDFYVTTPEYRDHEQKKEYEHLSRLTKYTCNQTTLARRAAGVLKGRSVRGYVPLSEVNESPFIYGTDIRTSVLLAKEYKNLYPDASSDSTLAILDYETDVVHKTGNIISGSLTMRDRVHLVFTKAFFDGNGSDPKTVIQEAFNHHLEKPYITNRNIKLTIDVVDTAADVVIKLIGSAHQWTPDFVGIWNISFDIPKMIKALEQQNIDPADVFSDPKIPKRYRYFKWREASKNKTTADGSQSIVHIADLWHTVTTPASFYFIDLMCLFKRTRGREQQRNSYSLDAILADELDIGKLRFQATEGLSGLEWHIAMQQTYKAEYLVYNIFDCISCELLDELTGDVSQSLRATIGVSELSKIASNPKRLMDDLHFDLLGKNKIIGSTSSKMSDEYDLLTPTIKNWMNFKHAA